MKTYFGVQHLPTLENADVVAFDCETTGLKPVAGGMRLLQFAADGEFPVVIDCWELDDSGWEAVGRFLGQRRRWVAHNAVFDLGWLQAHDLYPEGEVFCTMLASRVLTNGMPNIRHGLQHLVSRYLKRELSKEEQKSDWRVELRPEQLQYAALDVMVLVELWPLLLERLQFGALMGAWALECKALPAMAQLWRTGLPFDREKLLALRDELGADNVRLGEEFIVALDAALPEEKKLPRDPDGSLNLRPKATGTVRGGDKRPAGFNLNSPKQLLDVFTVLLGKVPTGPDPLRPGCSMPSASRAALREYVADHPVVAQYLAWKRVEKRRQMVESLLSHHETDGFIRASYWQMGADTGRMSCFNPNLQQVPRDPRFRACVVAPEGHVFVVADYAQMELRLAAAESGDVRMVSAFQAGQDLHTITAMAIYGLDDEAAVKKEQRQIAKSANFGLLYGSGASGLRSYAAASGIQITLAEAAAVRDKFHATYTGIARWQKQNAAAAQNSGKDASIRIRVSNLRRFLPTRDTNMITVRCNTPIQGAGAAVMKLTLGKLWPLLREAGEAEVRLAGAIHDELILLVREDAAERWAVTLAQVMEEAESRWLGDVPPLAEAKIGRTWSEAK
jgi:DNA polymerase I-like protein with 3'-5' exonuclease and polymerase domains